MRPAATRSPASETIDRTAALDRVGAMGRRDVVLAALCDTFVPGGPDLPHASALRVPQLVRREVEALGKLWAVRELDLVLDIVGSPITTLLVLGKFGRFAHLSLEDRERYLRRWAASPLPQLRSAFQTLKRLVLFYAYGLERSPYARAIGYTRPPLDLPAKPPRLLLREPRPGETIEADVCVVGSGAGGAIVAATLAQAGRRVVVLERGGLRTEAEFDGNELAGTASLLYDRGIAATDDGAIALLAGSAVGGGTVVNWTTSLRLPAAAREEWREAGIDDELGPHYAAVEERLHVDADESARNGPNAALERGLYALDLPARTAPRNVEGCGDCGQCGVGCRRGAKRSMLRTYLEDASHFGAEIIPSCEARRIVLREGRVDTVVARTASGHVAVRAPLVALAGGGILSPALLLRSEIATDRAGRDLHLHPTTAVYGVYEQEILPWRGVPQSVVSAAFADLSPGFGFRLECPAALPGLIAASLPWWGAEDHRERLAKAAHTAPFVAIVRDRGAGRVLVDRDGEPRVRYRCGPLEERYVMRSMTEMARIHFAAGARYVGTLHTPPLEVSRDGELAAFAAEVQRRGVVPNRLLLFSAHQMSTCRIGRSVRDSVADPEGQVWGVKGLYVADASAFPSASGVNPMLTIMALARRTATRMLSA